MSEQTVIDPNAQGQPAAAEGDAQVDDLDSLLSEFDSQTSQPTPEPQQSSSEVKELINYMQQEKKEKEAARLNEDLNATFTQVGEMLADKGLPDYLVRGAVYEKAESDPRFRDAFENRGNNPQAWNRVVKALGAQVKRDLEAQPDPQLTADSNALAAAVRGSSQTTPAAPEVEDISSKTDAELNAMFK